MSQLNTERAHSATTESSKFDCPLWRLSTTLAYVPISKTAWLAGVRRGEMPKPVQIPGTRAVAWRAEEVKTWIKELK